MEKIVKVSQEKSKKLNQIELLKLQHSPQETWEKLSYYAVNGFSSIADEDLNFFLKCFGIFYRPATGDRFMLRIRIPGGRLNYDQAKRIGELAKVFGNDYIDITTRMCMSSIHREHLHLKILSYSINNVCWSFVS